MPVKKFEFGELIHYEFVNPIARKCKDRFQDFKLELSDEFEKFIDLNDGVVQYELVITRKIN